MIKEVLQLTLILNTLGEGGYWLTLRLGHVVLDDLFYPSIFLFTFIFSNIPLKFIFICKVNFISIIESIFLNSNNNLR